ncbi:DNA alkylation repair protein [Paenibacillus pasadenensis]|uniref:DNA alkylation repair protein n=1 Tax=Paenibacillus pasadenensis TaxID=217090 RepID=UPI00203B9072|nr:DNA alkylation repair protein [Paenibacillus pasadenensis]MCM3747752.1 DNA alkylation repair protein [Paenibacillus pasadenensis]
MEPLRFLYHEEMLLKVGKVFQELDAQFDPEVFAAHAMREPWDDASFKERMRLVTLALGEMLPQAYEAAVEFVCRAGERFRGIEYIFFPDYIEVYGRENPELSLEALTRLTRYSTSEYAIRPFIEREPEAVMQKLRKWSLFSDEHIRRLASEGCRPRLPWGQRLPVFVRDPRPVLELLEPMLQDESEYVRRSVANNLNDIAKDHPELVMDLAERTYGRDSRTDWILRHGCRTLLKQAHPRAMALFGLGPAAGASAQELKLLTPVVPFGERLEFSFNIVNEEKPMMLRLEYEIGFVKANGTLAGKRFKLSEREYPHGRTSVTRSHAIKPITTRRYYPGMHSLTVLVNGVEQASLSFELTMDLD